MQCLHHHPRCRRSAPPKALTGARTVAAGRLSSSPQLAPSSLPPCLIPPLFRHRWVLPDLGGCRSGSHGLRGLLVRICSHRRWYGGAGWRMLLGRRRRSCSSVAVVRWCTRALRDLAGAQRRLRFVSAYLPCRVPPSSRRAS